MGMGSIIRQLYFGDTISGYRKRSFSNSRSNESEGEGRSTIKSDNTSNDTVRRSRNRITMRQFARKYNGSTGDLSRHFSRPIFANSHNKIFGDLQYIGIRRDVNQINSGICQNSSLS